MDLDASYSSSESTSLGDSLEPSSSSNLRLLNRESSLAVSYRPGPATFFSNHKPLTEDDAERVVMGAERRLMKDQFYVLEAVDRASSGVEELSHSQIRIRSVLGQGSFSDVYSISETKGSNGDQGDSEGDSNSLPPAEQLVVKMLKKSLLLNPRSMATCAADLVKESLLLSYLQPHPNLVRVYAKAPNGVHAYIDGRHDAFFLVLERLETTLAKRIAEWRHMKRSEARLQALFSKQVKKDKLSLLQEQLQIVTDLAKAVAYLHAESVIHRDLKPENIGFDRNGILKLFDFDVARMLPGPKSGRSDSDDFKMTARMGSLRYMSPECARGDLYNAKTDVYSFAIVVYELLSLAKPYDGIEMEEMDQRIFENGERPRMVKNWPTSLQSFLQQGWNQSLQSRPTMTEVQSEWDALIPAMLAAQERKNSKLSWLFGSDHPKRSGEDIKASVEVNGSPMGKKSQARNSVESTSENSQTSVESDSLVED